MKSSSKITFGIILIAGSVLALVIAFAQIAPIYAEHFSNLCGAVVFQGDSDSRMAYCISAWPPNPQGEFCCSGISNKDEIKIRDLTLRRDAGILWVDDQPIHAGETYDSFRWTVSLNPWLIFTTRFELKNEGLSSVSFSSTKDEVLYISGEVSGGWFLNPLGIIILGSGVWFFGQGKKEQKPDSDHSLEAGYHAVHPSTGQ